MSNPSGFAAFIKGYEENTYPPSPLDAFTSPEYRAPTRADAKINEVRNYFKRIKDRASESINTPDKFRQHLKENFITPNQDIIRDYMVNTGSTFEEAMKWAVKQDAINNPNKLYKDNPNIDPRYVAGSMLNNEVNKELNKRELNKAGIKRIN